MSLAAQIQNPQERPELVGEQIADAVGRDDPRRRILVREYDASTIVETPDDVRMAAVALAIAAGGAMRTPAVSAQYLAAR